MIDKSVVKRVAAQVGATRYVGHTDSIFSDDALLAFAQHFYKRGQDEQREKSANIFMAEPSESWMARDVASAIQNEVTK